MRRRPFTTLAALSLLLCTLSTCLLLGGLWVTDRFTWARAGGHLVEIEGRGGCVSISAIPSGVSLDLAWQRQWARDLSFRYPSTAVFGGPTYRSSDLGVAVLDRSGEGAVYWQHGDRSPIRPIWKLVFHWGMLSILAVLLPLAWVFVRALRAFDRRARRIKGLCLTCGYDLTGNTSGNCPECGSPAPTSTLSKA